MTYPATYDAAIRAAMLQWFPQAGWLWGKAQLIAESSLNPDARSDAGAIGLAQFMPDTWDDVREWFNWGHEASPFDPTYAIPAYARFMRLLWESWTAPRPMLDRLKLAQASYNAGLGNVIHAQRFARRTGTTDAPNDYASIIAALPQVTGHDNAMQTTYYVLRIEKIYTELNAGPLIAAGSS